MRRRAKIAPVRIEPRFKRGSPESPGMRSDVRASGRETPGVGGLTRMPAPAPEESGGGGGAGGGAGGGGGVLTQVVLFLVHRRVEVLRGLEALEAPIACR